MLRSLKRIKSLIIKEFMIIFRDPRSRLMLIVPPLAQLIVFSFAATLEVKNVSVAIFNEDGGKHGYEISQRIASTKTFQDISFVPRTEDFQKDLDEQKIIAAIHLPKKFSQKIESGEGASLQIIYDGRRSNAAQITNNYLSQVVEHYNQELAHQKSLPPKVNIHERHWFNENLEYIWFTIPSLVAILATVITLILAAMSLAREKELGTFDQLLVSPLMPKEILIGKVVPSMLVGWAEALFIFIMGRLLFAVPFRGSLFLMLLGMAIFTFSIVGFGLFISALAKTQQQAILGSFIFIVPAISLSGFSAPVENMPLWLQNATWLNPIKHALIIFKGLFLKDMPALEFFHHAWPLLLIGTIGLIFASWLFRKKLD